MRINRPNKVPEFLNLNLSESDAIDILQDSNHSADTTECRAECSTAKIIRWLRAKGWEITDD